MTERLAGEFSLFEHRHHYTQRRFGQNQGYDPTVVDRTERPEPVGRSQGDTESKDKGCRCQKEMVVQQAVNAASLLLAAPTQYPGEIDFQAGEEHQVDKAQAGKDFENPVFMDNAETALTDEDPCDYLANNYGDENAFGSGK